MAIYVVVLTKESTSTFWNDLSREIVGLHKPNTKVYFDYFSEMVSIIEFFITHG